MEHFDYIYKDQSFEGIIVTLAKDFTVLKTNQVFLDLNGYDQAELRRTKFTDMIIPKDKSVFLDVLYNNIITQDISIQIYHKTGAFRFYSVIVLTFENHFLVIGNEIKKEFIGYDYQNLTEKAMDVERIFKNLDIKDVGEFFAEENPALNFVLDVLPIDVWVKNKYAKYIYCNDTFTKHTGHSRDFVKNKSDFELFENAIAQEFVVSDNKIVESRQKLNYVFKSESDSLLTWTNVTKIPLFNMNGVYIGIMGFSIDITDSKNLEIKYQDELARTDSILENVPGIVCEISPKGEMLFISGKLKSKFNLDYEYAALKFIEDQKDPELREKIRFALTGNEVEVQVHLEGVLMKFTFTPVSNEKGSYNLIGIGHKVKGENNEES